MAILVVDDEPLVRLVIADSLRTAGYDVHEAADACCALELLGTIPDIALMCTDVQMPGGIDGVELARLVKRLFPEVRVIIISGFSPQQARVPGVPFLPKPFAPSALLALVRTELRGSASECPEAVAAARSASVRGR